MRIGENCIVLLKRRLRMAILKVEIKWVVLYLAISCLFYSWFDVVEGRAFDDEERYYLIEEWNWRIYMRRWNLDFMWVVLILFINHILYIKYVIYH